jgi:hypothetical protein
VPPMEVAGGFPSHQQDPAGSGSRLNHSGGSSPSGSQPGQGRRDDLRHYLGIEDKGQGHNPAAPPFRQTLPVFQGGHQGGAMGVGTALQALQICSSIGVVIWEANGGSQLQIRLPQGRKELIRQADAAEGQQGLCQQPLRRLDPTSQGEAGLLQGPVWWPWGQTSTGKHKQIGAPQLIYGLPQWTGRKNQAIAQAMATIEHADVAAHRRAAADRRLR